LRDRLRTARIDKLVYIKDAKIIDIEGDPDSDLARLLPLPERRGDVPSGHGLAQFEPTYYGRPAIKTLVWIWAIPAHFLVGGLATRPWC